MGHNKTQRYRYGHNLEAAGFRQQQATTSASSVATTQDRSTLSQADLEAKPLQETIQFETFLEEFVADQSTGDPDTAMRTLYNDVSTWDRFYEVSLSMGGTYKEGDYGRYKEVQSQASHGQQTEGESTVGDGVDSQK